MTQSTPLLDPAQAAAKGRAAFNELVIKRASYFAPSRLSDAPEPESSGLSQTDLSRSLARAADSGDLAQASALMDQGADPNWRSNSTSCAAFKAIRSLNPKMINLLASRGARYPSEFSSLQRLSELNYPFSPSGAQSAYDTAFAVAKMPGFNFSRDDIYLRGLRTRSEYPILGALCLGVLESNPDLWGVFAPTNPARGMMAAELAIRFGAFELADRLIPPADRNPWIHPKLFSDKEKNVLLAPIQQAFERDRPEALFYLMERGFANPIAENQWRMKASINILSLTGAGYQSCEAPVSLLAAAILSDATRCAHALARVPEFAAALQNPSDNDLNALFTKPLSNEAILAALEAGFDPASVRPDATKSLWLNHLVVSSHIFPPPIAGIQAALRKKPAAAAVLNKKGEDFLTFLRQVEKGNSARTRGISARFSVFIDQLNIREGIGAKRGSKAKRSHRI